jgi:uncharacterized protein YjbJ (UPF0337 family)
MVDENRIEGTAQKVTGKVREVVSGLTDDAQTKAEGATRQVVGTAQNAYVLPAPPSDATKPPSARGRMLRKQSDTAPGQTKADSSDAVRSTSL